MSLRLAVSATVAVARRTSVRLATSVSARCVGMGRVPLRMQGLRVTGGIRTFATKSNEGDDDTKTTQPETVEAETVEPEPEPEPEPPKEIETGPAEDHEFQAETRKLLDIVANSLYSDKEVFVRELVSNSSDALEKLRYMQVTGDAVSDADIDLEIKITTNDENGTLVIQDTGIGMKKEELVENLGCIARSGTKSFVEGLGDDTSSKSNLIGQFGVGFYSTFMVGSEVTVFSKSATPGEPGHVWKSDGSGKYSIAEADNVVRGTKIIIKLNDRGMQFAKEQAVQDILEKHSNFVGFPVSLNGNRINNVEATWLKQPSQVSEDEHRMFYRFVANAFDEPLYTLHYSADAPLQMRTLFYVPTMHSEKMGMGRMEPGVSLYCRKVLVLDKAPKLLPEWLRFMKGVVDSSDIPLNLSRELLQDSALIQRISTILSARLVRFFADQAKREPEKYQSFHNDYGDFLREGACTDFKNQKDIMKLLRYESSKLDAGELCSLQEYVDRMPEDQDKIYYMCCSSREIAESSPYTEALLQKGVEILYSYAPFDDVVFVNVQKFGDNSFVSVETNQVKVDSDKDGKLSTEELDPLCEWLKDNLGDKKVSKVFGSDRLVSHPAIVSDELGSAAVRRMMRTLDKDNVQALASQELEINPSHTLIKALAELRERDPETALLIAEQVFDNALVHAGLMDDARPMLARVTKLMESLAAKA